MPGLIHHIRPFTDQREASSLPKPKPNLFPHRVNMPSNNNHRLPLLPYDQEIPTKPPPSATRGPVRGSSSVLHTNIPYPPQNGNLLQKSSMVNLPCGVHERLTTPATNSSSACGYGSSGSLHNEPSSVCLAAMVNEFMESENIYAACKHSDYGHRFMINPDHNGMNSGTTTRDHLIDEDILDRNLSMDTSGIYQSLQGLVLQASSDEAETLLLKDVEKILKSLSVQGPGLTACDRDGRRNASLAHGCMKRIVISHLQKLGYNAAICKSRWDHSGSVSAGDYEYIDVLLLTNPQYSKSKQSVRLIVDIDFQAQFEIARPTEDFAMSWQLLPPIFVGKPDKLQQIIVLMSEATKKSLRVEGLHLPPWRKLSYMKAKWFSSYKRTLNCNISSMQPCKQGEFKLNGSINSTKYTNELEMLYHGIDPMQATVNNVLTNSNQMDKQTSNKITGLVTERKRVNNYITPIKQNKDQITVLASDWQLPAIAKKSLDPSSRSKQGGKVTGLVSLMLQSRGESAHGIMAGAS